MPRLHRSTAASGIEISLREAIRYTVPHKNSGTDGIGISAFRATDIIDANQASAYLGVNTITLTDTTSPHNARALYSFRADLNE